MAKLTTAKIKSIKKPGMYGDGGSLFLRVAPGGSKAWVVKVQVKGRTITTKKGNTRALRREIGLGGVEYTSLAEARNKAIEIRQAAREGIDPVSEKLKVGMPSFREAVEKTFEAYSINWREKHKKNWRQVINAHAMLKLADLQIDQIGRAEIVAVISPIWNEKPETGRKLKLALRQVMEWAKGSGFCEHNAVDQVNGALPVHEKLEDEIEQRAHDYIPYQDAEAVLKMIREHDAPEVSRLCLEFLILTGVRSGEARGARCDEIKGDVWELPGARTKNKKKFRVPLSGAALDVLEKAKAHDNGSGYVFPSSRRGAITDYYMARMMKKTEGTIHGWRSTLRTYLEKCTSASFEVKETCLNHSLPALVRRYQRDDLLDERRAVMQAWGAYVTGANESAKVISIAG